MRKTFFFLMVLGFLPSAIINVGCTNKEPATKLSIDTQGEDKSSGSTVIADLSDAISGTESEIEKVQNYESMADQYVEQGKPRQAVRVLSQALIIIEDEEIKKRLKDRITRIKWSY
jgi:predicted negative regulator of RcsB-dependent stress response